LIQVVVFWVVTPCGGGLGTNPEHMTCVFISYREFDWRVI